MSIGLSVPGVSVNDEPIAIVPNSFIFKMGKGEIKVRAANQGGNSSTTVHTQDAESQVGKMKWKMYVTQENINLVSKWKENIGGNTISAAQTGQTPQSMQNASMVNDPDFEGSADGTVEIEFQGDQLSNNF